MLLYFLSVNQMNFCKGVIENCNHMYILLRHVSIFSLRFTVLHLDFKFTFAFADLKTAPITNIPRIGPFTHDVTVLVI